MVACFALAIVQLVNIQVVKAPALRASAANPRNAGKQYDNQRGTISAADGTVLATSVPSSASSYHSVRQYPQGSLYAQVVGYASAYYGTAGIENEYNDSLITHTLPAQTFSQTLGFAPLANVEGQPDVDDQSDAAGDRPHSSRADCGIQQGRRRLGR